MLANAPLLLSDRRMLDHLAGVTGHPERPQRLQAIIDGLADLHDDAVQWQSPREPQRQPIERVHDVAHVDRVLALRGTNDVSDSETPVTEGTVDAALLSMQCAIEATDAVLTGGFPHAFSLARPPGHHANQHTPTGFCFFNNVAIAAQHAIDAHGLQRVAIIDWDVHHGNGTQDIFYDRDDVLYVSSHQWPWYPGTGAVGEIGAGDGEGRTVNLPIPAGLDDAAVLSMYRRIVAPVVQQYQPQLVLISAGYDKHRADPLGGIDMTETGFAALTQLITAAAAHCACTLALILEGGYDLNALSRSVRATIDTLRSADVDASIDANVQPSHAQHVDELARAHSQRWSSIDA